MRLKKEKPKGNSKKKQVEEEEKDNQSDDGQSVASTVTPVVEKPTSKKDEPQNQAIGSGTPSTFVDTAAMYDWRTLMETIIKIQSCNFWYNSNLAWG